MKKLFSIGAILLSFAAQSQITLTRADFPRPTAASTLPDSLLFTTVTLGTPVSYTTTGPSSIWSETSLGGTTSYQSFVPLTSTPILFQLAFLSCDFAQPLLGNAGNVGGNQLSDAYEYYNYTASNASLELKGFGGSVVLPGSTTPLTIPAVYSPADVIYRFPLNFGNVDSSNSGFDISLPVPTFGNIQIKRSQTRVNTVDGWGQLTTPWATFDVLRVASKIDRIDSVITAIFPIATPSTTIEYKWLAQNMKIPVLQINTAIVAGVETVTNSTYIGGWPTAVNNYTTNQSLHLFPNPATENCTIDFTVEENAKVDIYIYGINGAKTGEFHYTNLPAGKHKETLPIMTLPQGIYSIQCVIDNKVSSTKLLKL